MSHAKNAFTKLPKYAEVEQVSELKFSSCWIDNLLTKREFRRKRLTAEAKPVLPDAEINKIMAIGQTSLIRGSFDQKRVWNLDETAHYEILPAPLAHRVGGTPEEFQQAE